MLAFSRPLAVLALIVLITSLSASNERIGFAAFKPVYRAEMKRLDARACNLDLSCDRATGCVAPARPQGPILDVIPTDGDYRRYLNDLKAFEICRSLTLLSRQVEALDVRHISYNFSDAEVVLFAETTSRWNGAYLWAPASASADTITRFGDEVRAVFGEIPEGDCSDDAATIVPVQIEGNIVDLKPNKEKHGHPLEFEHRDPAGKVVKWTPDISQCDKPSLAGSASYCGINSRLTRREKGPVDWLFFCRKSGPGGEVQPTPYWLRSNPKFALFGIIGYNRLTGEIAFFDGRKDRGAFDWSNRFAPPGGRSYADSEGRATAEALYDPTFQVECSACHDNKGPYVITPSIQQMRVGFAGASDPTRTAFSLGTLLPSLPRNRSAPLRVIGSGYTGTHRIALSRAMTVQDPTGNCTECHTLTTQITGQRFAADAVAMTPTIKQPDRSQYLRLMAEQRKLREIATHRTQWASRSGEGKIHPWMVPIEGNDLAGFPAEMSASDWDVLSNCLWNAGGAECNYQPLYTSCPRPGAVADGDTSEPTGLAAQVLPSTIPELPAYRRLRLKWKYLNSYGAILQRDDVRFDIAVTAVNLPMPGSMPALESYPSLDEATGNDFKDIAGGVGSSGKTVLVRDLSYLGHATFTDPAPSVEPRVFQLDLPGRCNRRYLVRIVPKRYCFDQQLLTYGPTDYLTYADVRCD
jgi:hypothetical protein